MDDIYRLATMFHELAVHTSRIKGEQAERINSSLMFEHGLDGVSRALEKEGFKLGPNEDKDTFFILDSDGNFLINAFVESYFDHGAGANAYRVRPKDMRGLIKEYEVDHDDDKKKDFINSMEAYHRWQDDGLE